MATVSKAKSYHGTLGAGVDIVTITGDYTTMKIVNRGDNPIYFTGEGATPTIAGDDTDVVAAGTSVVIGPPRGIGKTIRLIGTTGDPYSVVSY